MKKEVILILFLVFGLVNSINVFAQFGCCINPGAGDRACLDSRLVSRDSECCPSQQNFPNFYNPQNPNGPSDYNDCINNFFFPNTACSAQSVTGCSLGCCCSNLGGTIKPEAQCKGSGLAFYNGQTNCDQICPAPQCSQQATGGTCSQQAVADCTNPNYNPRLSSLQIVPSKGQAKFSLSWQDECTQTAISYEILRCTGNQCTNFNTIGISNSNSFQDSSGDLAFDTTYTYMVKAHYNLQTAVPSVNSTATLGNAQCSGRSTSNAFCYNNAPYSCDVSNRLISQGNACTQSQVCIANNNQPSCVNRISCNYDGANPFGLFYTQGNCENNRYCFYDRSQSTVNSCFGCDPSMSCYDYKTQDSCTRDNCNAGNCRWKSLANQLGIGVCISTAKYNCQWCDKKGTSSLGNARAFNDVFDLCTKDKSDLLSEGQFNCFYKDGKSKNCNEVVCSDYGTSQCGSSQITHDQNNALINPSNDQCGINVCQVINNACVKNADGDNAPDCSDPLCEKDYFAPNTTSIPITSRGVTDTLLFQIYDQTSPNSSAVLKTSPDYTTYMCVEPCGLQGHPYPYSTSSRTIVISNLNAFDGSNGSRILTFNDGTNVVRYYSQDPSKNIEIVKKITLVVHDNTTGPRILNISITDGSKVLDKYYTINQMPAIQVRFFEPALVTFARLVNKRTGQIIALQATTGFSQAVTFQLNQTLQNDEYSFELNAKNSNSIFMNPPLATTIVIDNNRPTLIIEPANNTILNSSVVALKLNFDKQVNLNSANLNSDDIKANFTITDNKIFTAVLNLQDGNKEIDVGATDYAGNSIQQSAVFIVDANPDVINLVNPMFGTSPTYTFDFVVSTDNNAVCKYSLDNSFEYDFMDAFTTTGNTLHTISSFSRIASGDTSTHTMNVKCRSQRGISSASFNINVDAIAPQITTAYAYPNPVVEHPSNTTLTVQSDKQVICKYNNISSNFAGMEGKFRGFENNEFKTINTQPISVNNQGSYHYFVACKSKSGLISAATDITFNVDLTAPLSIISHTPEFFNSTNPILAIETNKRSQCKFSETDSTAQTGEIFGIPGYSHTRQLILAPGKHTFYIICKDQYLQRFSDVASVTFTIDITPPIVLYVNDSSTLPGNPQFTWNTDYLRVIWKSVDNESRIGYNQFTLLNYDTSNTILNWTTSYANNEWVQVRNENDTSLGLINGNKYYFKVKAVNVVGLSSDEKDSDAIGVDTSLKPLNCTNGIKDGSETSVDCGGGCDLCETGKNCLTNSDCKSNFCSNGVCEVPTCNDNIRNQGESGIDCGGPCKKCDNNQNCNANSDCSSNFCSFGFCKPQESCSDGKLSPGESSVDCGGPCPTKCPEGSNCNSNNDCIEGMQCIDSLCKKCADNDLNCNGIPDNQEQSNANTQNETTNTVQQPAPHPSKLKTILIVFGIIVIFSGLGYFAYRIISARKTERFEMPKQTGMEKIALQQQVKQVATKQREDNAKLKEALKKKEEQKEKERVQLFGAFGAPQEKQHTNEIKEEKAAKKEPSAKRKAEKERKPHVKKSKEDVFIKLKEIAKETKKKKVAKKNAAK